MTLESPRFVSSSHLAKAENGSKIIKKGSRGRHVHLLQMALIDLGYQMPRSIGRIYSPDGIFGRETEEKVMAYQTANNLHPDGKIGSNTMMALDHHCQGYMHRVKLHFRSIALANIPFERTLSDAQIIFGQYSIKFEYASGKSLFLSDAQKKVD